ncbi:adenosylcobinamide-phosphate synthase CbiB [Qiania dongpingensis]|uniref:Cobalamin biosynthesis protein CobD n=1 Tax=Qiania dongpingensis TaxID=2763669 RepID=A0A7G9G4C9_9FIRM|nr:adenosylcobinamide-phosphate synthase CbiB [Qiania dongpingensis]QNM05661.1 cobalamin biosynthesis protein CobD [Qiania dongpingensis]
MKYFAFALGIGFLLDMIFGDPCRLPHPVCLIGSLISILEKKIRSFFPDTRGDQMAGGVLLVFLVLVVSTGIPFLVLYLAGMVHPYLRLAIESFMCYQLLAARSLKKESMKVYRQLKKGDLERSRKAVGRIVGRDTEKLSEEGVIKAAVETVAENTSDGVIAPMLYMAFGGAVLGYFYKAVNTMDSMIAYKNEKYLYFGRAAAWLDDICNYIPARISAFLMMLSSAFLKMDWRNAWMVFWRDRHNHASPNSAQTESVCAGALDIQLAGDAWYFGVLYKKKTIGDAKRPAAVEDIRRANRLMYMTSALGLVLFMGCSLLLYRVIFKLG